MVVSLIILLLVCNLIGLIYVNNFYIILYLFDRFVLSLHLRHYIALGNVCETVKCRDNFVFAAWLPCHFEESGCFFQNYWNPGKRICDLLNIPIFLPQPIIQFVRLLMLIMLITPLGLHINLYLILLQKVLIERYYSVFYLHT